MLTQGLPARSGASREGASGRPIAEVQFVGLLGPPRRQSVPSVERTPNNVLSTACLLPPHLSSILGYRICLSAFAFSHTHLPRRADFRSFHTASRITLEFPTHLHNGRQGIHLLRRFGAQHQEGPVYCRPRQGLQCVELRRRAPVRSRPLRSAQAHGFYTAF